MSVAVAGGQVVDTPSALEFMQQVLEKTTTDELAAIAGELAAKSERFRSLLTPTGLEALTEDRYHRLLRSVFATRRRAAQIRQRLPLETFRSEVTALLYAQDDPAERFQRFFETALPAAGSATGDLASELLHYTFPNRYWLWTRWMWDPSANTGALRLVTMGEYDLHADGLGQTYLRVGEAVAFVRATGEAAGFVGGGEGLYGTHLYLACVYVIYMYTVLRIRMTQEFNQVVPRLPELCRRLLGVHRLEV